MILIIVLFFANDLQLSFSVEMEVIRRVTARTPSSKAGTMCDVCLQRTANSLYRLINSKRVTA
jgi:hypothetical protein